MYKLILACVLTMFLFLVSFAAVVSNSMDNSNEAQIAGSNDSSSTADSAVKDEKKAEPQAAVKSDIKMNVETENNINAEEQLDKNTQQEPEIDAVIVPEPEKAEVPAKNKNLRAESFIVQDEWAPDGIIMGDKDNKLLISTGDTVYVTIDKNKIKPGLRCGIYRKMERIKDDKTKEYLGYEIRRIGKLEFTDKIGKKVSSAKVIVSYEPVQLEDVVKLGE